MCVCVCVCERERERERETETEVDGGEGISWPILFFKGYCNWDFSSGLYLLKIVMLPLQFTASQLRR